MCVLGALSRTLTLTHVPTPTVACARSRRARTGAERCRRGSYRRESKAVVAPGSSHVPAASVVAMAEAHVRALTRKDARGPPWDAPHSGYQCARPPAGV